MIQNNNVTFNHRLLPKYWELYGTNICNVYIYEDIYEHFIANIKRETLQQQ